MALDALEDLSGPLTQYFVVVLRQLSLCDPVQFRSGRRAVLQQDVVLPVPQVRWVRWKSWSPEGSEEKRLRPCPL